MKIRACGIAVVMGVCSIPAMAGFQIQYSDKPKPAVAKAAPAPVPEGVMLLDKAYRPLSELGTPSPEYVAGSGTDVPMPLALQMLLPSGWRVLGSTPDIGKDALVDWSDGELLVNVLERAAADNGLHIEMNWDTQRVTLREGQSKGTYSQMVAANVATNTLVLPPPKPVVAPTPKPAAAAPAKPQPVAAIPSASVAAAPVAVTGPVVAPAPVVPPPPTIEILRGETLRAVARRLADQLKSSRALLDLRNGALAGLAAQQSIKVTVGGFEAIQRDLVQAFGERMNVIRVRPATDPLGGVALVLTDRSYDHPYQLRLFEVQPGSIRDNAKELAKSFGWFVAEKYGWQLGVDYTVRVGYPLVLSSVADGYDRLFDGYPVQAQLIEGNSSVIFVSRVLPVSER